MGLNIQNDGFYKAMSFISKEIGRKLSAGEIALAFTSIVMASKVLKNPIYAKEHGFTLSRIARGCSTKIIKYMVTSNDYRSEEIRESIGISKANLNDNLYNAAKKDDSSYEASENIIQFLTLIIVCYFMTATHLNLEGNDEKSNLNILYEQSDDIDEVLFNLEKSAFEQGSEILKDEIILMRHAFELVDLVRES